MQLDAIRLARLGLATALVLAAAVASAQTPAPGLEGLTEALEPGDTIFVTGRTTGEVRGTLTRLSSEALVLVETDGMERRFASEEIAWVERYPDRPWDGAVVGALAGYGSIFGIWALGCLATCSADDSVGDAADFFVSPEFQRGALSSAALFAGVGLVADLVSRNPELVHGTRPPMRQGLFRAPQPSAGLDGLWALVAPGDTVFVTARGERVRATFTRASAGSLTVTTADRTVELAAAEVTRVERHTNRVWQGMLVGTAAGAALLATAPYPDVSRRASATIGAFQGWFYGTLAGALLPRRVTLYEGGTPSPDRAAADTPLEISLRPAVGGGGGGLALSISF
jgi:hypothetical protein